jgi:rhodanese-related sulfurtransferase
MNRPIVQVVILIAASFVLALTANALASRQRKVMLVGWYPNATKVSSSQPSAVSSQAVPAPAPVQVPVAAPAPQPVVPTTTTTATSAPTHTAAPAPTQKPSTPAPQPPTPPTIDISKFRAHPDKAYVEIAFDDVNALHSKGVLFLDARRTSVYEQGHISEARPFSVWESDIDDKVNKFFEERSTPESQALPIVIYCSGGDCEDSHMLAQKLWGIQYNNVYVYKDGFPDWQKRGGAVRTGAQP